MSDLALLNKVLMYDLSEHVEEAFRDMQMRLEDGKQLKLTEAQRAWVTSVLDQHEPTYLNLASSGKVPRGREVPTPEVLRRRPLRPPGR